MTSRNKAASGVGSEPENKSESELSKKMREPRFRMQMVQKSTTRGQLTNE